MTEEACRRVLVCLGGAVLCLGGAKTAWAAEPAADVRSQPTCAVVAFESVAPVKASESEFLANRYATVLTSSGMFSVMPRLEMYETLREKRCLRSSYRTLDSFAQKAGETLGVAYAIYGTLQRAEGDRQELTVNILDVRTGKIVQTQKTLYPRDLTDLPPPPPAAAAPAVAAAVPAAPPAPPPPPAPVAPAVPAAPPVSPPVAAPVVPAAPPAPPAPPARPAVAPPPSARSEWFDAWTSEELRSACAWTWKTLVQGRLEPGLRMTRFHFISPSHVTYDSSGTILGGYVAGISTYNLEELQEGDLDPYVRYWVFPCVGLQVAWERVAGRAWTLDTADPHYDGDMILSGPSLMVMGRYPNRTRLTPYGGVGLAWLQGDFREESSWSAGGFRNMSAGDDTGTLLTLGCEVRIWRGLQADLSFSYLEAESAAAWWYRTDTGYRNQWTWPASSYLTQFGLTYAF